MFLCCRSEEVLVRRMHIRRLTLPERTQAPHLVQGWDHSLLLLLLLLLLQQELWVLQQLLAQGAGLG